MLVKDPVPVPSEVFELDIVGVAVEAQQTPRAVISSPPSFHISPPPNVDVAVEPETSDVVTEAIDLGVSFLQPVAKAIINTKIEIQSAKFRLILLILYQLGSVKYMEFSLNRQQNSESGVIVFNRVIITDSAYLAILALKQLSVIAKMVSTA